MSDHPATRTTADGEVWKGLQQGTACVVRQLEDRIARAIDALNEAPDLVDKPTKREIQAITDANMRAWIILTEGIHPPSIRKAREPVVNG